LRFYGPIFSDFRLLVNPHSAVQDELLCGEKEKARKAGF
jgi:hypothetical protein